MTYFAQGYHAYRMGVKREECPYTGVDATEWFRGWDTARKDLEAVRK